MVKTYANFGYDGSIVDVAVDIRSGISATDIIGLGDEATEVCRKLIKRAINSSGFNYTDKRVLVSLEPADIKKDGSCAAAIALAVLLTSRDYSIDNEDVLVMGKLMGNGQVVPCSGIYAACEAAKEQGVKYAILPHCNESQLVTGMKVFTVRDLSEAYETFVQLSKNEETDSLDSFEGYASLKYAMLVAACGGHHMITVCRPGSVEEKIMQHFNQLLLPLDADEKKTVYKIHSIAGFLNVYKNNERPFRTPHQTASIEGICGGGIFCRPGEVSLAHNGALFLRDAMEYRCGVLQMLRVPMETGYITLSRAGRTTTFPARFQLVMTASACPCGNYHTDKLCLDSVKSIKNYWSKLGGPLLGRVPIRVMDSNDGVMVLRAKEMRAIVKKAYKMQRARRQFIPNQWLGKERLSSAYDAFAKLFPEGMSGRAVHDSLCVARTLADMEGREDIIETDVRNALRLRAELPAGL